MESCEGFSFSSKHTQAIQAHGLGMRDSKTIKRKHVEVLAVEQGHRVHCCGALSHSVLCICEALCSQEIDGTGEVQEGDPHSKNLQPQSRTIPRTGRVMATGRFDGPKSRSASRVTRCHTENASSTKPTQSKSPGRVEVLAVEQGHHQKLEAEETCRGT